MRKQWNGKYIISKEKVKMSIALVFARFCTYAIIQYFFFKVWQSFRHHTYTTAPLWKHHTSRLFSFLHLRNEKPLYCNGQSRACNNLATCLKACMLARHLKNSYTNCSTRKILPEILGKFQNAANWLALQINMEALNNSDQHEHSPKFSAQAPKLCYHCLGFNHTNIKSENKI